MQQLLRVQQRRILRAVLSARVQATYKRRHPGRGKVRAGSVASARRHVASPLGQAREQAGHVLQSQRSIPWHGTAFFVFSLVFFVLCVSPLCSLFSPWPSHFGFFVFILWFPCFLCCLLHVHCVLLCFRCFLTCLCVLICVLLCSPLPSMLHLFFSCVLCVLPRCLWFLPCFGFSLPRGFFLFSLVFFVFNLVSKFS